MRRIALIAVLAIVAVAVTAPAAGAVNSILNYTAKVTPNKAGTKSKPASVGLNLRPWYDTLAPDADAPFAWKKVTLSLPKELVFNGKFFPSCPTAKIANAATRPSCKKAIIGKVNAKGFALGLVEPLVVGLYNSPGGKGIALHIVGDSPLIVDAVVEGVLAKISGPKYGYTMVFSVPADLQQPAPGAWATPMDFDTRTTAKTIKKGKKKIPFVGLTGCPAGGLPFAFHTDNTDGTSHDIELTTPCKK